MAQISGVTMLKALSKIEETVSETRLCWLVVITLPSWRATC